MDVVVKLDGIAVGIPRIGLGLNAFSASYIQVNAAPNQPLRTYGVAESFSVGGDNSTLVYGTITTAPINLSPEEFQAFSVDNVSGKSFDIQVSGTVLVSGKADITISLIDDQGRVEEVIQRKDIKVKGGQLASTNVRGRARLMPH